jgi:V-type H+-transporting ATPase subunit H
MHVRALAASDGGSEDLLRLAATLTELHKEGQVRDYSYLLSLNCLVKHTAVAEQYFMHHKLEPFKQVMCAGNDSQLTYTLLVTLWLLSFGREARLKMADAQEGVLKYLIESCGRMQKEKVMRIAIKLIHNLKQEHTCVEALVDGGFIRILDSLGKGFIKDEALVRSMEEVGALLEDNIKVLSSLDKYKRELNNKVLDWGHVHTDKFWKEHVKKFDEDEFLLVKKVIELLKSKDSRTVAVSCYDLGEFSRFYPYGKKWTADQSARGPGGQGHDHPPDQGEREPRGQGAVPARPAQDHAKQLGHPVIITRAHYSCSDPSCVSSSPAPLPCSFS